MNNTTSLAVYMAMDTTRAAQASESTWFRNSVTIPGVFGENASLAAFGNGTNGTNGTEPFRAPYEFWQASLIVLSCSLIIFGTILGNVLVCIAVAIVRKLRTPSNLLIVSLAVSDLLVAILVMPFAVAYEVMGMWQLGQTFCDAWTSLDVMLCTASILNLCMISVDRYSVITRPLQYAIKRTPKRMALMIAAVWVTSALITIPPLFGWQSEPEEGQCSVSQEIGYQFYATIGAFYLPLTVMIIIYYKIYMVSSRIAHAEARWKINEVGHTLPAPSGANTPIRKNSHLGVTFADKEENHNFPNGSAPRGRDDSLLEMIPKAGGGGGGGGGSGTQAANDPHHHHDHKLFGTLFRKSGQSRFSFSKERKATKTLGVIMGAFTACWLPFFILALIRPFYPDAIPQWLHSLFLWLGYANSFLNPVIYARFNREFRTPFKEILLFRCMDIDARLRMETYTEQYGPRQGSLKDCIRHPQETVVRYHSQGQTFVKLGNGQSSTALNTGAGLQL